MSEQSIFQEANVTVTASQLVYGNDHYSLHTIKSVVYFKEPFDAKSFMINIIGALLGLVGIFSFKSVCLIGGLLAVAVCGFNLYNDYNELSNPNYVVAVTLHSGESIYIKRRSADWARRLYEALTIAMRG